VLQPRSLALMTLPLAAALGLAGCGSSSGGSTAKAPATLSAAAPATGGATSAGSLADEVPAAIKSKGTLTVAADASYAPNEFIMPGQTAVVGMDADLAQAIGQQLGLRVTVVNAKFDAIIPGLAAGRYDLGMSSFTDTKEREKTVDFVTYFSAGTSFFTKASGGTQVASLDALCGVKVSVETGTTQQTDADDQSKKCTAAGKPAVDVLPFDDQSGANLALSSGRAQVSMADSPVAAYQVKQSNGAFALSGMPYGTAPYGIAIPKGNGMAKPVQDAVKALIADGTYNKILTTWGVQAGAITDPAVDGATS